MATSLRPRSEGRSLDVGESYEFIKMALDHGVGPESCANGQAAIWEAARFSESDAEAAKIIGLLLEAGWSATETREHDEKTPSQLVAEKEWSETAALLTAAGGLIRLDAFATVCRRSHAARTSGGVRSRHRTSAL